MKNLVNAVPTTRMRNSSSLRALRPCVMKTRIAISRKRKELSDGDNNNDGDDESGKLSMVMIVRILVMLMMMMTVLKLIGEAVNSNDDCGGECDG